jgi:hypothetical protein
MSDMKTTKFWNFFDSVEDKLLQRQASFRKMFQHLELIERPIVVVETGCVRNPDPWAMTGEGQSTILFDRHLTERADGSRAYSVDINPEAVAVCRSAVSDRVQVHEGDSVAYLNDLTLQLQARKQSIDLLYLDSFDVDYNYWFPSAAHHLKELLAAWRCVTPQTLVVVDDCPLSANLVVNPQGNLDLDRFYKPIVGGKGRLVAEFADQVGAKMAFSHYQHGWTGF